MTAQDIGKVPVRKQWYIVQHLSTQKMMKDAIGYAMRSRDFLNNVQEKNILLKHYINVCREKIMVQEKELYLYSWQKSWQTQKELPLFI